MDEDNLFYRHIVYYSERSNLISKNLDPLLCHQHLEALLLLQNYQLFFSQASERAEILNPRIWLANHTHVTGPAFYDTAHRPDFFPLPKFRS